MNSILLDIANYFKFFICLYIWLQNSCFFPRPWKIHVIGINKTCQWSSQSYKQCHGNSWWHTPCHRGLLTHEKHVTSFKNSLSFKPCYKNLLWHTSCPRIFFIHLNHATGILSVIQTYYGNLLWQFHATVFLLVNYSCHRNPFLV